MSAQILIRSEIVAGSPEVDAAIRAVIASRRPHLPEVTDYSLRVIYEAYEITGIWIDLIILTVPGEDTPLCMYQRPNLVGEVTFGASRIRYLGRTAVHLLGPLLSNVKYTPAPQRSESDGFYLTPAH